MKKFEKKIGRYLGWVALKIIIWIIQFLSMEKMYKFADMLADLGCFLLKKHRRIAMNNLNLAYGKSKTVKEKKELIRLVFRHFAYLGCELGWFYKKDLKEVTNLITIEGEEYLKEALMRKKGVIMIGAHLGNFPLIGPKLNYLGYSCKNFMKITAHKGTEKLFQQLKEHLNEKSILVGSSSSRDKAAKEALYWLRKGGILGVYIDQKFGKGIPVDFFGHPALTASGAAVYALKTKAPVVPIFIVRQEDHTHKIIIEQPLKLEITGDKQKDILLNMTNFTKVAEKYIRRYPSQWFWLHRRWKGIDPASGIKEEQVKK